MDYTAARKTQKAGREKMRRDRLNEHFAQLGKVLDPGRPKSDKATILNDTIQLLNDLTSQVSNLKDEYTALNEESRELVQEKNDMKEEKASLKSDIEIVNNQYQQRLGTIFPWTAMDHSVMMAPPPYLYPMPVPVPVPPGPIPMQFYPHLANQNPPVFLNPCSTCVPYIAPSSVIEQQSTQYILPPVHEGSQSQGSNKLDAKHKPSRESRAERSQASNEVTTDLELKTPGSSADQRKYSEVSRKENSCSERSSVGRCSSSHSIQDSTSSSIVGSRKSNE